MGGVSLSPGSWCLAQIVASSSSVRGIKLGMTYVTILIISLPVLMLTGRDVILSSRDYGNFYQET